MGDRLGNDFNEKILSNITEMDCKILDQKCSHRVLYNLIKLNSMTEAAFTWLNNFIEIYSEKTYD